MDSDWKPNGLCLFDFGGVLLMRRDSSENHKCFGMFIWESSWKPATSGIALGNHWGCSTWGFQNSVTKGDRKDLSGEGLMHQAILDALHFFNY